MNSGVEEMNGCWWELKDCAKSPYTADLLTA